ncbi:hypothetical protein [Neobacillus sp. YIM B06451]|nr:hypothetical protein [Neobacillus sp. YIM B06451]
MNFLSAIAKALLQFGAISVVVVLVFLIGVFYLFKSVKKNKRDGKKS